MEEGNSSISHRLKKRKRIKFDKEVSKTNKKQPDYYTDKETTLHSQPQHEVNVRVLSELESGFEPDSPSPKASDFTIKPRPQHKGHECVLCLPAAGSVLKLNKNDPQAQHCVLKESAEVSQSNNNVPMPHQTECGPSQTPTNVDVEVANDENQKSNAVNTVLASSRAELVMEGGSSIAHRLKRKKKSKFLCGCLNEKGSQHKGNEFVPCLPAAAATASGLKINNNVSTLHNPQECEPTTETQPDVDVQVADENQKSIANTGCTSEDGLQSPSPMTAHTISPTGGFVNVDRCDEAPKTQTNLHQSDCTSNVLNLNKKLPFVRTWSSIWDKIDSSKVFQTMEYPHFNELNNVEEGCREGFAVGKMLYFLKMVNEAPRLKLDDGNIVWDSYLKSVLDLEANGFNVKVIRRRFDDLVAIKDKYQSSRDEMKDYECQLMEKVKEDRELGEVIDKMNEEKRELGEEIVKMNKKMKELGKKHIKMMANKEDKESEIHMYQKIVDELSEGIRNTQRNFERVVASRS